MSWSELSSHMIPADGAAPDGALRLGAEADDYLRVGAVLAVFSEGSYEALRITVGGTELGVLTRDTVLDLVGSDDRAIGTGDGASLAGVPVLQAGAAGSKAWSRWRCPVPGCPEPDVYVIGADSLDPPACAVHPEQVLEAVAPG
jgi:hypothetical protein